MILLFGANGQLGQSILRLQKEESFLKDLIAFDRKEADLSKPDELIEKIKALKPSLIINAAAYTKVDLAETEVKECFLINSEFPEKCAKYCAENDVIYVHYSTDYVYSGEGESYHKEEDMISPHNVYGHSKAKGDEAILNSNALALIFRTSWVYSHHGKNFVLTMKKLSQTRDFQKDGPLNVVSDQIGSPTYSDDLAKYSIEALKKAVQMKQQHLKFPTGVYHLCNSELTNWAEFAKLIIGDPSKVKDIATADYKTPAKRPLNSRLSLNKIEKVFGIKPRSYKDALRECLSKI